LSRRSSERRAADKFDEFLHLGTVGSHPTCRIRARLSSACRGSQVVVAGARFTGGRWCVARQVHHERAPGAGDLARLGRRRMHRAGPSGADPALVRWAVELPGGSSGRRPTAVMPGTKSLLHPSLVESLHRSRGGSPETDCHLSVQQPPGDRQGGSEIQDRLEGRLDGDNLVERRSSSTSSADTEPALTHARIRRDALGAGSPHSSPPRVEGTSVAGRHLRACRHKSRMSSHIVMTFLNCSRNS
jgi:hypothetical protein